MTESTSAPISSVPNVTASSPKKAKKTTKGKSTQGSSHPKYSDMIKAALKSLNERSGSSRAAILKFVLANYSLDPIQANQHLKSALKNGVKSKNFKQTKGNGASGSFKLAEGVKPAKKKSTKPKKTSSSKTKKVSSSTASSGTKKRALSKSAGSKPAKKVAAVANTNVPATATTTPAATTTSSTTTTAAKPKKVTIAKASKPKSSATPKSANATKTKKPKQSKDFFYFKISINFLFLF
jgi:histone H1/5